MLKKKRSLKRLLYTAFLFMIIYLLAFTASSFFINYSINNRFNKMLIRTGQFANLLVLQTEIQNLFELCLRSPEKENTNKYLDQNKSFNDLLSVLEKNSGNAQKTKTYLRIIRNIQDYQLRSSLRLFGLNKLSPDHYNEISYMSLLFKDMNQQAQELAVFEQSINMDDYSSFFKKASSRESSALVILSLIIFIFGISIIYTLNGVLKKTTDIISAANTFSKGKVLQEDFPQSSYIELNAISLALNNMKEDINHYVNELKDKSNLEIELHREHLENEKKDKLLKVAQLDFLKSQINPHFLFNTLNIIGKSSVLDDSEKSMELIESISLILRYTLEHPHELVQIKEELAIVRAYLFIQKTRFSSRLSFDISVPDSLLSHLLPPMIIQPLVENSIKHGIETVGKKLNISIIVVAQNDSLLIRIIDDGPGFQIQEESDNRKRIGIENVKQRLALRYNNMASIEFSGFGIEGTEVVIKIPLEDV